MKGLVAIVQSLEELQQLELILKKIGKRAESLAGMKGHPDPPVRRSLGAQRLHHIDARSACRGQHRRDNRDGHQYERRD
jgi:hypothetical protein